MTLKEFNDLWNEFDLFDDLLVERDIGLSFNLSMMT